jgi:hypothetical protein
MVHLAQTMQLSCTETNTVSKRTEMSFHLSLVTQEYHPVHPKQFLSLWLVLCNPCSYLESWLALSRNEPKRASICASSPRSNIRCVQNDFRGYITFGANCGAILHRLQHYLQTDRNKILHDPDHLGVPSGASKMISEPMLCSAQTVHLSWIKISTVSKWTKTSFYLSLVT